MIRAEVAMLLAAAKVRRWTKSEYYQAVDLGWFDGQRVELIDGEVVEMPAHRDAHAYAVMLAQYALGEAFGKGYAMRVQLPMDFGSSQPEPDVAMIRGALRAPKMKKHPKTAELVVEIADSTLVYDREVKSRLYASRGIRDYWVVNLIDRVVEVKRRPVADRKEPFGHAYEELVVYRPGKTITPLALKGRDVQVRDLLP